ncbi:MAG: S41 family peptidase [Treponema sp.]|nr:S41 family peptidase [Treponema sp.]MDY5916888.1 S41 family peptidase [Treponema sp.]
MKAITTKKESLSQRNALEDFDICFNLLTTSSASFIDQESEVKEKYYFIKNEILSRKEISLIDFFNLISNFGLGIKDLHSYFFLETENKTLYNTFSKRQIAYSTECLFEKKENNKFVSVDCENQIFLGEELKEDTQIASNKYYFGKVIRDNKEFYKLIKFSVEDRKFLIFDMRWNCGGVPYKQVELLFHLFKLDLNILYNFNIDSENAEDLLEASQLISKFIAEKNYKDLINNKDSWKNKDKMINFWKHEYEQLNDNEYRWHIDTGKFDFPWYYNQDFSKKIKFSGKIIFLVNLETSSFGELFYDYITKIFGYKNIVMIGTNTCGMVAYNNPLKFRLKNSGIVLNITTGTDSDRRQTTFYKKVIEGRGFFPEYWCSTDEEIIETINFIVKKEENNEIV